MTKGKIWSGSRIRAGGPAVPATIDGGERATFQDAYQMFGEACRNISDHKKHLRLLHAAKGLWFAAEANRRNRHQRGNLKGKVRPDDVMDWMTDKMEIIGRRPGVAARLAIDAGQCGKVEKGEPRQRKIRDLVKKWERRNPLPR